MFATLRDDLKSCTVLSLKEAIGQLHGGQCATHAALLATIAEVDDRRGWASDGANSMVEWLAMRLSLSHSTAAEWVRVAHALQDLPKLADAYSTGRISWDKLRSLSRIATPETEADLLDEGGKLTVLQLDAFVRRARRIGSVEAKERDRSQHLVIRNKAEEGYTKFWGRLPDAEGAIFRAAIEQLADAAPKDPETGYYSPYERRCADALVSLAEGYLGGAQNRDSARNTLVVHVDAGVLQGEGGAAELEDGTPIAPETAQRLGCDSFVELVFNGRDGEPVGIGRRSRKVPAWLARQIRKRDLGCRFPGCSRTRLVQSHHIHYWTLDGPTDKGNLVAFCRYHHKLFHEGGWRIRGSPDGVLEFIRPDGEILTSHPPEVRPEIAERLLAPLLPRRSSESAPRPGSVPAVVFGQALPSP